MRSLIRVIVAVPIMALTITGGVWAQSGLTRQDRQGPVTVVVTPASPLATGTPLKFKMALDTHSVNLDGIAWEQAIVPRLPGGREFSPDAVEQAKGSGHHREAVLAFPAVTGRAESILVEVSIVVKNVGGVGERIFTWPLATGQ